MPGGPSHRRPTATSRSSSSTTARPMDHPSSRSRFELPFPIHVIRNDDEPLLLRGERTGGRDRRGRAGLLPQQRRRSDHRRLARVPGRDDGHHGGSRRRRPPHLPQASRRRAGGREPRRPDGPARRRRLRSKRTAVPIARVMGAGENPLASWVSRCRAAAGPDRRVPARPGRRVPGGRRLLARIRLRRRGCRPVPQAPGGRRPARVRRPGSDVASRIGDAGRGSGPLQGTGRRQPRHVHPSLGAAPVPRRDARCP